MALQTRPGGPIKPQLQFRMADPDPAAIRAVRAAHTRAAFSIRTNGAFFDRLLATNAYQPKTDIAVPGVFKAVFDRDPKNLTAFLRFAFDVPQFVAAVTKLRENPRDAEALRILKFAADIYQTKVRERRQQEELAKRNHVPIPTTDGLTQELAIGKPDLDTMLWFYSPSDLRDISAHAKYFHEPFLYAVFVDRDLLIYGYGKDERLKITQTVLSAQTAIMTAIYNTVGALYGSITSGIFDYVWEGKVARFSDLGIPGDIAALETIAFYNGPLRRYYRMQGQTLNPLLMPEPWTPKSSADARATEKDTPKQVLLSIQAYSFTDAYVLFDGSSRSPDLPSPFHAFISYVSDAFEMFHSRSGSVSPDIYELSRFIFEDLLVDFVREHASKLEFGERAKRTTLYKSLVGPTPEEDQYAFSAEERNPLVSPNE